MGRRRPTLKTAFLDSSVLFTAVNSPSGGSAKLFTIKNLKLTTSTIVLTEVERNVKEKLEIYHLERFFMLVNQLEIISIVPNQNQINRVESLTVKKDAPILASFLTSKAHILVTLDKKHLLTESVEVFIKPSRVLNPKMLLEEIKH